MGLPHLMRDVSVPGEVGQDVYPKELKALYPHYLLSMHVEYREFCAFGFQNPQSVPWFWRSLSPGYCPNTILSDAESPPYRLTRCCLLSVLLWSVITNLTMLLVGWKWEQSWVKRAWWRGQRAPWCASVQDESG